MGSRKGPKRGPNGGIPGSGQGLDRLWIHAATPLSYPLPQPIWPNTRHTLRLTQIPSLAPRWPFLPPERRGTGCRGSGIPPYPHLGPHARARVYTGLWPEVWYGGRHPRYRHIWGPTPGDTPSGTLSEPSHPWDSPRDGLLIPVGCIHAV